MNISIRRIFKENNEPIKYLSNLSLSNSDIIFINEALQSKNYPHIRVIHWGKHNEEILNENSKLRKAIQSRLMERVSGHRILQVFVENEEPTKNLSDLILTESDLNIIKNEIRKFPYISCINWGEYNLNLVNNHPEIKSFIGVQLITNVKNQLILSILTENGEPVKDFTAEDLTIDHLNLIHDELLKHARHVHWIIWGEKNSTLLNNNQILHHNILDRLIDNIMNDRENQLVINLSNFEMDIKFLECLNKKLELNSWAGGVFWGMKNEIRLGSEHERSVISQIEKKLAENNQSYKRYPSDYVFCLLASCCRNPKDRDLLEKMTKLGWEIETKFDYIMIPNTILRDLITRIGGPVQGETKSAAILYKNQSSRQLVLAFRGVIIEQIGDLLKEDEDNLLEKNVYGILGKEITTLSYYSYLFAKHAFDLSLEMNFNLSFTGYSFGAWLAEQSVFFCYNELKTCEVKAVTFDSPGSLDIIKKLFNTNVVNLYISEEQLIRALNIKTYLLSPNFVNTANEHLGKVYRLYDNFDNEKKAGNDINNFIESKIIDKIPSKKLKKKFKKWYDTKVASDLKGYAFFLNGLRSLFTDDLSWILSLFDEISGHVKDTENLRRVKNWPKMNFLLRSDKLRELEVFDFDFGNVFPLANKFAGILAKPLNVAFNFGLEAFAKNYFSKGLFFLNLILEFLNGSLQASECMNYYKYSLKVISSQDETSTTILDKDMFKLVYIGNYATEMVSLKSEKLNMRFVDIDKEICDYYYGIQQKYTRFPILEDQLNGMKKSIRVTINSAMFETTIDLANPKETDIESVKDKFWRLFKLYDAKEKVYQIYRSNEHFQVTSDNFDELESGAFIEVNQSYFTDIDDLLKNNNFVYIYGPIGSGKTTLAKQYRLHKKNTYTSFFIVSSERLNYNLQELHLRLFGTYYFSNNASDRVDTILLDKITRKINAFGGSSLLFVFDDVKSLFEIEPIVKGSSQQKFLITTKNQSIFECYSKSIGIKAKTFDVDRSVEYFRKRIKSENSEQVWPHVMNEFVPSLFKRAFIVERPQADEWSLAIEEISKSNIEIPTCILEIGVSFCKKNPDWKVEEIKHMLMNKTYYDLINPKELNVLKHLAYLDGNFISLELIMHLLIDQLDSFNTILNDLVKIGFLKKVQREFSEEEFYIMPEVIQSDLKATLDGNTKEKKEILTKLTFILNNSITYELDELRKYKISILQSINKHTKKLLIENWQDKSKDENFLMLLIKVERINNEILYDYEDSKLLLLKIIELEKGFKPVRHAKLANLLIKIGTICEIQNSLDDALVYFKEALIKIEKLVNTNRTNQYQEQTNHLLDQIGAIYLKQNRYDEALEHYEMALKVMSKNYTNKSSVYNNLGLIYKKKGEIDKSIEAFKKAIEFAEYNSELDKRLANFLNNLGDIYNELENYGEAQVYYEKALSINKTRNKSNDIAISYRKIGSIYLKKKKNDIALEYYSKALENIDSDCFERARILSRMGHVFKSKELYQEALDSYGKALEIHSKLKDELNMADLYYKISLVYYSLNEFDKAAENWEEARKIREKLNQQGEVEKNSFKAAQ